MNWLVTTPPLFRPKPNIFCNMYRWRLEEVKDFRSPLKLADGLTRVSANLVVSVIW